MRLPKKVGGEEVEFEEGTVVSKTQKVRNRLHRLHFVRVQVTEKTIGTNCSENKEKKKEW
jgi:hypothetical protein